MKKHFLLGLIILLWVSSVTWAQNPTAGPETTKPAETGVPASTEAQMLWLNQKVDKLGQMVEQQQHLIEQQQRMIEELRVQLTNGPKASLNEASATPSRPSTGVASNHLPKSLETAPISDGSVGKKQSPGATSGGEPEKKLKISTIFFGDYAFYIKTGFSPQFLDQINHPGPGNNHFNSFDITRAYLNVVFTPNEALTFRLTPDIYRTEGAAVSTKLGKVSAVGSNLEGNLALRLKYAYLEYNKLFHGIEPLKGSKLTIGQQPNPLIDWEEHLYGYRFVNLVPWNFVGFSSTQVGVAISGPVKFHERKYLDYSLGVYNNASFRSFEQSEKKQVMARASYYPAGAKSAYDGLGVTGFFDYGFVNVSPDADVGTPLYRVAALTHYTAKTWGIAAEFDFGRNAFSSGSLFSGSGPADEFGGGPTPFAAQDALAKTLLNNDRTRQQGFDVFGHLKIPKSPFEVFGMLQHFLPNTTVSKNPFDFQRVVLGVSYRYNEHLRLALTSQNLRYTHRQFTFPTSELLKFDPALAAKYPNGIQNAVLRGTNAIFLNLEFSY